MKKCKVTFEFKIKDGDFWDASLKESMPMFRQNFFDFLVSIKSDLLMKFLDIQSGCDSITRRAIEEAIAKDVHVLNGFMESFKLEITEEKEK